MKAINKAQNLDLTLVAYVKKCKKRKSEKADPVAEDRVLKWWREHDSPPAATSTHNSPWPEHQPADLEKPIQWSQQAVQKAWPGRPVWRGLIPRIVLRAADRLMSLIVEALVYCLSN
jgi:bisphosphoglycerate-dependent phosphoglycerate mutase